MVDEIQIFRAHRYLNIVNPDISSWCSFVYLNMTTSPTVNQYMKHELPGLGTWMKWLPCLQEI